MYRFVCSNGHTSYSSAKEQTDMSCPQCKEPCHPVGEETDGGRTVIVKFDERSTHWSQDPDINALFVTSVFNYLADVLKAHGFLFLNDAFRELGLPRTSQGQLIGWLYSEKETWWTTDTSTEIPEEQNVMTLTFYTQGVMYDKIEAQS